MQLKWGQIEPLLILPDPFDATLNEARPGLAGRGIGSSIGAGGAILVQRFESNSFGIGTGTPLENLRM